LQGPFTCGLSVCFLAASSTSDDVFPDGFMARRLPHHWSFTSLDRILLDMFTAFLSERSFPRFSRSEPGCTSRPKAKERKYLFTSIEERVNAPVIPNVPLWRRRKSVQKC
jgi:hypothetical protein